MGGREEESEVKIEAEEEGGVVEEVITFDEACGVVCISCLSRRLGWVEKEMPPKKLVA